MIPQKCIFCILASAHTGTACIRANFNSSRILSCMHWLCARGFCSQTSLGCRWESQTSPELMEPPWASQISPSFPTSSSATSPELICGLRVGARGLDPPQGVRETGPLRLGGRKGIPKNLSSQVFGEVRVNFSG